MPTSKLGKVMQSAEQMAAEGGLVNDRSGQVTMRMRLEREKRARKQRRG